MWKGLTCGRHHFIANSLSIYCQLSERLETPLITHWSYHSLALSQWYVLSLCLPPAVCTPGAGVSTVSWVMATLTTSQNPHWWNMPSHWRSSEWQLAMHIPCFSQIRYVTVTNRWLDLQYSLKLELMAFILCNDIVSPSLIHWRFNSLTPQLLVCNDWYGGYNELVLKRDLDRTIVIVAWRITAILPHVLENHSFSMNP